jgi:ATP adenylyltransferase
MFRTRKSLKQYKKSAKISNGCPFCEPNIKDRIIVKHGIGAMVTKNDFGYSIWEGREVIEHLLVVPHRHVANYTNLTTEEKAEIFDIISEYEAGGYDVYARGAGSVQKTVPAHQHTHLIKTRGSPAKLIFFMKKPYYLIKF